ncbi:hypothetical protein D3C86_2052550 [compost metagenome]
MASSDDPEAVMALFVALPGAFAFWEACGLKDTGERKTLEINGVRCQVHLHELRF